MSRILFDHNVPANFRRHLPGHEIRTADEEGGRKISNGYLISLAEQPSYNCLLTCDRNLSYQANLPARRISVVVLRSDIWPRVILRLPDIQAAISRIETNSFQFVEV